MDGSPASPAQELIRLNSAISLYNATIDPDLPAAVAIDPSPFIVAGGTLDNGQVQTPDGPTSVTIDFTSERYTYLLLKFGPKDVFYYVGNETGTVTFDNTLVLNKNNKPLGLSHYDLFDSFAPTAVSAPEGGATVAMLGASLLGLFGVSGLRARKGR